MNSFKLIGSATRPGKNCNLGRLFGQRKSANDMDLVLERPQRPPEVLRGNRSSLGTEYVQREETPVCWDYARGLLRAQRLLGDDIRQHATVGTRQVPACDSVFQTHNWEHPLDEAH